MTTAPTTPPIAVPTITTLSGAARQTVPGTPRSRKSLLLVASGLVVAAGVSIFALHGSTARRPRTDARRDATTPSTGGGSHRSRFQHRRGAAGRRRRVVTPTPPVVASPAATVPKHHPPVVVKHLPPKDVAHPPVAKDPEQATGSAAPPKVLIEKDL